MKYSYLKVETELFLKYCIFLKNEPTLMKYLMKIQTDLETVSLFLLFNVLKTSTMSLKMYKKTWNRFGFSPNISLALVHFAKIYDTSKRDQFRF